MLGSSKSKRIDTKTTDTLIGASTICEGKIMSEASLRIEGQLHGDIECAGDITIGENAVVQSNIQARDVIIAGKVKGNIHTKGKLLVTSSGVLVGNIDVRSFIVQEGGIFQGSSAMQIAAVSDKSGGGKVIDAQAHKQQKNEQQAASGGN
ncbi:MULTISPECIES: polymer-forming cytoskeletal protein [Paenibacillus]|uniref:Polymer-forming cytoskeletal protein n=1 Tax=Paenibacillus anseongense TaxID=2682845 RepID=A0ABW9U3Z7_9BACL|nr:MULTISPECIES: polymer-forming cytoskeletal protein [Paenibacillus]MBA2943117.1 polymer-forming cytoskeletal protein [Paenibacillus sp. CGMCC 1.16610]MVQ33613.1 polymer-forming cytoskeletal protein [Paenibacillus anseongense]